MKAIDADKLCTDLMERWDIADKQKEELIRQVMADIVTPIVVSQPTIEPKIIRCKDCRYADEDGVCQNSKGLAIQDDYDFCSYAERRTDETD